ncbi:hypothetical protein D9M68_595870 [compost metagenome]
MHLVARAVEEARVDEGHAGGGGFDAGFEVDAGAALLVHDAHLQGVARQLQQVFDTVEEFACERGLGRAVHLGLHDVDGAGARIQLAFAVLQRGQAGDHGVQDALGDFAAVAVQDGRVGHQMAHVAHEHERTAVQGQRRAVRARVLAVRVQFAGEGLAALGDRFGEVALHQAEPVAVDLDLVGRVHGGDGVFAVHDGGQCGFDHHVLHAGRIGAADGVGAIDLDLEMQAVVLEQDGRGRRSGALVAGELRTELQARGAVGQRDAQLAVLDGVAAGIGVRALGQRRGGVQEGASARDDGGASLRVIARARVARRGGDGVGAVEGVVQAAPARVGGVQRVARVGHGHDQLRAGLLGDLGVDVVGGGAHGGGLRQQVADAFEEPAVGGRLRDGAGVGAVPGVELGLQAVAFGQQRTVLGGQVFHQGRESLPETVGIQAGAGQRFLFDELVEIGRHLQAVVLDALSHAVL